MDAWCTRTCTRPGRSWPEPSPGVSTRAMESALRPGMRQPSRSSNGRPACRGARPGTDAVRDSLNRCIKCTICESFSPYAKVAPVFPGPTYVGPQAERYRGAGPSVDASVDYCSGCGICTQVCPQGVKIAEINSQARAAMWEKRGVPLRNQLIATPSLIAKLGTPVAGLANATLRSRPLRAVAEKLVGVHRDAPLPSFAGRTFRSWA